MLGSAVSWRVAFPVDMNEMLAAPTNASATSSSASTGATVASDIATPKPVAATTSGHVPVRPRVATTSPPATAPKPIAAVMKPKPVDPAWSPREAM
jgi:hypothetical protein